MADVDRKALRRDYKETPRPAGVYRVRNTAQRRALVGSSPNLPGILNRHRFQLDDGSHTDKELQRDWRALGADAFSFDVLDELPPQDDADVDVGEELAVLLAMWRDKLAAVGETFYGRATKP